MRGVVDKVITPLLEGLVALVLLVFLAVWLDRLGAWHDCGASFEQSLVWGVSERPTLTQCQMVANKGG